MKTDLLLYRIRESFRNHNFYYEILDKIRKFNSYIHRSNKGLKEYYKNCILFIPENSRWRHFRFFLQNGGVVKIKDQIRDITTLRKYLLRYFPVAVFYSTSAWLDPKNISKNPTYHPTFSNNLFLYNELVFDIDSSNLEVSRIYALTLIKIMENKNYTLKSIRFTGSKGFHILFNDHIKNEITDPIERELYYKNKRRELVDEILEYSKQKDINLKFDCDVTINTRAIIRLPTTVNCKTGYVCTEITYEQLKKPIQDLLKDITLIKNPPKSGVDNEPKLIRRMRISLDEKYENLIYNYNAYFISNRVLGLKDNFAIFLRYGSRLLPDVISNIKNLQNRFKLTDFYLFKTDKKEEYFAICLKTVNGEYLKKIIKYSESLNKNFIDKNQVLYLRISPKFDNNQNILTKNIVYLKTIKASNKINNESYVSNPHSRFLRDRNISIFNYKKIHGSIQPIINYNSVKNGKIINKKKIIYTDPYFKDLSSDLSEMKFQNIN